MAVTEELMKRLRIRSAAVFNKLLRYGWVDGSAREKQWHEYQRDDHDERLYSEPKEFRARGAQRLPKR